MADDNKTPLKSRAITMSAVRTCARQTHSSKLPESQMETERDVYTQRSGLILDLKTVAVIDDDADVRESMEVLLAALGYYSEIFDSAESFLAAAATSSASCLLVDIELGDLSGIELVRQLAAEGFKYPIIFMTGRNDDNIRSQAEAAGCIAFLSKPFPAKLLRDAVSQATG
jgi:FixJ family two-component response regulator